MENQGGKKLPGFDFVDFEIAKRSELLLLFPTHAEIIERLADYDE